jgi:hypothetical protein
MNRGFKFAEPLSDEIKKKRIEVISALLEKGENKPSVYMKALSDAGVPKISGMKLAQLKRHVKWMKENGK